MKIEAQEAGATQRQAIPERVVTNDHLVSLEIRQAEELDKPRRLRKGKS